MPIPKRNLGGVAVSSVSLGCMNLSHAYGRPPAEEQGIKLIQTAFDLGINHFDTAILYGFGKNEILVGKAIKPFRQEVYLASKCGLTTPDLKRKVDGRPEAIKQACEDSLKRLQTDAIDLYYLHRWDKTVPVEESVGALKQLVEEGKVQSIGLSEVSASTLRRAQTVHPISAVQTEYSLWTRNADIAVMDACKELNIAFVAFSPLARGYLTGTLKNPPGFAENDLRNNMPRFQPPHYAANLALLEPIRKLSLESGVSMAKLALAWMLNKHHHLIAIPGTTSIPHLQENCDAAQIDLSVDVMDRLEAIINEHTVHGPRYNQKTQQEIDTEQFE